MTKQVPQGYKQTSVGVIPEDWEVVKINQVLNKIIDNRGKTPPYNNSGNGIALIETNAISFSIKYPDYTKISKYVENDTYISCFRDHPQKGDVLISTVGEYAGASAILKDSEGTIAQNLIAFRPNENINSTFLFYWTRSKLFFKQLKQVMMNQAQPSLKVTWLIDFLFIEPSQKEQEKIVEILSAWDDAIAKQEELIQQKQQFKKGVMQQIFSQKIRFKDDDGSEYPAWEEKKLGDVTQVIMGQSPSSEAYNLEFKGIPLIQGNADCVQRFTKPRLYTTEITKKCYPSDILMSVRAPVGSILYSLHEACIGRGICVIKPLDAVNNSFLFHFLVYYENKWERVSQGSTFESVNGDDIRRLLINIPNLKEQNKIAGFLTTIDDEITKQNEVLAELKIQKKSLMQKLLTGQVRAWIPAYAGMTE